MKILRQSKGGKACINIDAVLKIEKKNYPQVYSEEFKYKVKKAKMSELIDVALESTNSTFNSSSDFE